MTLCALLQVDRLDIKAGLKGAGDFVIALKPYYSAYENTIAVCADECTAFFVLI